jgi:hypothetical protein
MRTLLYAAALTTVRLWFVCADAEHSTDVHSTAARLAADLRETMAGYQSRSRLFCLISTCAPFLKNKLLNVLGVVASIR